ncbi:hypothetical protein B878_14115 [Vibrio campbellii CAIM 519 = NBRC 15631 = ATCC 25920]|nr:hypothetical protein B878_14115 [Vibrio campbellii CAIM 519 = NBRC 15631 = ATCC 25920]
MVLTMITENDKTAVMECYHQANFYPASEQNYDWLDAVFLRHFDRLLTIADPFCGSGTMALASILNGHQVLASDASPLSEMFIATILADYQYFSDIQYQTLECKNELGKEVIEKIIGSDFYKNDIASNYALIYCANGLIQGKNVTLEDFSQCQSNISELLQKLVPYTKNLNKLLDYKTSDLASLVIDNKVDICYFDPPYFQRGSFKQALQPLLNFMGNRITLSEDENFLKNEALYQKKLCQWLEVCYGTLLEDGMLLFTVSAENELQRHQIFKACGQVNLAIHTDYYLDQPYFYCIK